MEAKLECSFYCNSRNIDNGRGFGLCNFDGDQTICNGDLRYCEKPNTLSNSQEQQNGNQKNRRKHPRVILELPLEYRVTNIPHVHGALIINGSEMGLLMESVKNIPVGTNLNITVLFPEGYEMGNFEVSAQIVWKEVYWKEDWEGYQYGLKFVSIRPDGHWKLRKLLREQFELEKTSQKIQ